MKPACSDHRAPSVCQFSSPVENRETLFVPVGGGYRRRLRIRLLAAHRDRAKPGVTVTIDAAANRHPINPNIYGVAYATTAALEDLNAPLNRYGGNNTSRYNWQLNADNRGSDWYFESIADSSATPGERGDTFISNAQGRRRAGDAHHPA